MFFFSVQTMATIGYGKMEPVTLFSNILVSIEALTGLLALALMTGLVFSKFSRPTARVRFTRYVVIGPRDGVNSLMIRAANMRANRIVEAIIHVVLARQEDDRRGRYDSPPLRSADDAQPQRDVRVVVDRGASDRRRQLRCSAQTRESIANSAPEIIVSIIGLDETFSQTVHARHTFELDEIVWGARFARRAGAPSRRQPQRRLRRGSTTSKCLRPPSDASSRLFTQSVQIWALSVGAVRQEFPRTGGETE